MTPFVRHEGIVAPLLRDNVDTDQIIPSREMKTVSKTGLGEGLFASWRYTDEKTRTPNPEFILNRPGFEKATILLAGRNFGCGSSREHAVWALSGYGIRAIIAASFGSIFHTNCVRNGILPITLDMEAIQDIADIATKKPVKMTIDLQQQCLLWEASGEPIKFQIDPSDREMLVKGLDPIGLTMQHRQQILDFMDQQKTLRPWLFPETD
ncbi:MAG: 3-isopropylmalate dehydratase small subunit [Alphaproteobacteria bacterium]|nr:MAG: 3-isopropylmalate dehydratase small subunit [Alphaproteobacteria bacterium]